jgi:hypothetical protein
VLIVTNQGVGLIIKDVTETVQLHRVSLILLIINECVSVQWTARLAIFGLVHHVKYQQIHVDHPLQTNLVFTGCVGVLDLVHVEKQDRVFPPLLIGMQVILGAIVPIPTIQVYIAPNPTVHQMLSSLIMDIV